jgi:hypothetical protein
MSEISELLDAGIVATFYTEGSELSEATRIADAMASPYSPSGAEIWDAFESEFVEGLSAPLQALWRQVRSGNRSPNMILFENAVTGEDPSLAETFVEVLSMLNEQTIAGNAIESAASTIAVISQLGGSADILSSSPLMTRLLFAGAPDPAEQARVHELGGATVPNIDALAPSDLVKIRADSESLFAWRTDLAAALDYADRQRKARADPSVISAGMAEMLADARARVGKEVAQSKVWTSKNMVTFITGSLAGAGGAVVGGTPLSIAAGGAVGLTASIVQAVADREKLPGFLDRHYLAFKAAPA